MSPSPEPTTRLKIGAVARLVGVSAHTIRKWEERYGTVSPERTPGGGRLYTRTDLDRLVLIKRLADSGIPLADLAPLDLDELKAAWGQDDGGAATEGEPPVRAVVLGATLGVTLQRAVVAGAGIRLLGTSNALDTLRRRGGEPAADVLVIDAPVVDHGTAARVRAAMTRVGVPNALVVYHFARAADLLVLRAPNIASVRGPGEPMAIIEAAVTLVRPAHRARQRRADDDVAEIRPPRLTPEQIAAVAAHSPAVECECPTHLAELIGALRAFEDYSMQCESRNEDDAAIHRYLWRCAAQARAVFEDAVEHVAEAEGIVI